jgi:hypothetical protein
MSDILECDNCGAVLLESDLFCGECGAARSTTAAPPEVSPREETAAELPAAPAAVLPSPASVGADSSSRQTLWRIVVIALGLSSVLLCVVGLAAFLLFGLTDSDVATPQENWLYSTICCLLPLAGPGVLAGLAALGLWFARLRNR